MITFGKLEGRVTDGGKSIDVFVDGVLAGMISVYYDARRIGATRRVEHVPTYVEGYVHDAEIAQIEVNENLTAAITKAKNAIRAIAGGF